MKRRNFINIVTTSLVGITSGLLGVFKTPIPRLKSVPPQPETLSALDRMNVRTILDQIKEDMMKYAECFIFEPNDARTRENFRVGATALLTTKYVHTQTIEGFTLICDETNNPPSVIDSGSLNGQLFIQPRLTPEWVVLDFSVFPTGNEVEA